MSVSTAVPHLIGRRYHIHSLLGKGGMGQVYRATDLLTRQTVALKQMRSPNPADENAFRLALTQEFQTLASLRHPNIISVLDYGFTTDGAPFFTMDLIENAQDILDAARAAGAAVAVHLFTQVFRALSYLHRRGVLHRDIKPANILVSNGQVKLLDFGLAAMHIHAHDLIGTPAYMSPEVMLGQQASEASDLYAVGVVMYEAFTGQHPFDTTSIQRLISQILHDNPDYDKLVRAVGETRPIKPVTSGTNAPSIRPTHPTPLGETILLNSPIDANVSADKAAPVTNPLAQVVQKLLMRERIQRYQDAREAMRDLSAAFGQVVVLETPDTRESFLQSAPFTGREVELAALTNALQDARTGKGGVWLVGGESGVGKSRLLQELRVHALVGGFLVVRGQVERDRMSYQVWREPLRRLAFETPPSPADLPVLMTLIPDLDDLADSSGANPEPQLLEVVTRLLESHDQTLLILLEDLHWARAESLALLNDLQPVAERRPILIVGSYRDDEGQDVPARVAGAHRLKLNRLSPEAVTALSRLMIGEAAQSHVRDFLQRQTEGNVYFLIEVLRALAEEAGQLDLIGTVTLPPQVLTGGVQQIVQRRLERVPAQDYALLRVAAVLGREIDPATLKAAAPQVEMQVWLLECADAAVLDVQDGRWRFSHDKLRESVQDALNDDERAAVHQKAAEALETVHPDLRPHAAALARHWQLAGSKAKEQRYVAMAGEQAFALSDNLAAVEYFDRAISLLDDPASEIALTMLLQLGTAYGRLSRYTHANAILEDVLEDARHAGLSRLAAEALRAMGRIALQQGENDAAKLHLIEALALFRAQGSTRGIADTLASLGRVASDQGDLPGATAYLQESLTQATELGDRAAMAYASNALSHLALMQGAFEQAITHINATLSLYRELHNRNGIAGALMNLGIVAMMDGRLAEALEHYRESLALFRQVGERSGIAACLNNLGMIALSQDDPKTATIYFSESLLILADLDDHWGLANVTANLGHAAVQNANTDQAFTYYLDALKQAHSIGALPLVLEVITGIARLRAKAGRIDDALRLLALPLHHPATSSEVQPAADVLLTELLKDASDPDAIHATVVAGKAQDLDAVVKELLQS